MNYLTKVLTVEGMKLYLDGKEFKLQGLSFFNALHNPDFNQSREIRLEWLKKYKSYGINMLRVWCQWDLKGNCAGFCDVSPEASMFTYRGEIRTEIFHRLKELLIDASSLDMVIEIVVFCHENYQLPDDTLFPLEIIPVQERSLEGLTRLLLPYRNIILQVWNECSFEILRYYSLIKCLDPERVVTNSPGYSSELGDEEQNTLMDILTPHTARSDTKDFWNVAAGQIKYLMDKFGKPVIDDEPARSGLTEHGGIPGGTKAWQHIEQIKLVRELGAYHLYHHDMFQNGYGHPNTPINGIPDPELELHKDVFNFLRDHRQLN